MKKYKPEIGDIVMIEWKPIKPHRYSLKGLNGEIGYIVENPFQIFGSSNLCIEVNWFFPAILHPSCIHYIGKL